MEKMKYESLNKFRNKNKTIQEKYELLYKVNENETHLKILGDKFVEKNKLYGIIIYKNKKIPLVEKIEIKNIKSKELKIYLLFYDIIYNKISMFENCVNLLKFKIPDEEDIKNNFKINNDEIFENDFQLNVFDDLDETINSENELEKILNNSDFSLPCSKINETDKNSQNSTLKSIYNNLNLNLKNQYHLDKMFYNCTSLIELPNIYKWNYNNIRSLEALFYNCTSLKSLPDISQWDT